MATFPFNVVQKDENRQRIWLKESRQHRWKQFNSDIQKKTDQTLCGLEIDGFYSEWSY